MGHYHGDRRSPGSAAERTGPALSASRLSANRFPFTPPNFLVEASVFSLLPNFEESPLPIHTPSLLPLQRLPPLSARADGRGTDVHACGEESLVLLGRPEQPNSKEMRTPLERGGTRRQWCVTHPTGGPRCLCIRNKRHRGTLVGVSSASPSGGQE